MGFQIKNNSNDKKIVLTDCTFRCVMMGLPPIALSGLPAWGLAAPDPAFVLQVGNLCVLNFWAVALNFDASKQSKLE